MTNFGQKIRRNIPYFIVTHNGETSSQAGEDVLNRKGGPTFTKHGCVRGWPTISERQRISEGTFMQAESELFDW